MLLVVVPALPDEDVLPLLFVPLEELRRSIYYKLIHPQEEHLPGFLLILKSLMSFQHVFRMDLINFMLMVVIIPVLLDEEEVFRMPFGAVAFLYFATAFAAVS